MDPPRRDGRDRRDGAGSPFPRGPRGGRRRRPLRLVGLYDAPGRDLRGNVSAAYLCLPTDDAEPEPRAEARRVGAFVPGELPPLGFDRGEIVADALGADD